MININIIFLSNNIGGFVTKPSKFYNWAIEKTKLVSETCRSFRSMLWVFSASMNKYFLSFLFFYFNITSILKGLKRTKLQSSWKNINHIWIRYLNGDWCLENDVIQCRTVDYDIWVKSPLRCCCFKAEEVLSQTETWVKRAIKVLLFKAKLFLS